MIIYDSELWINDIDRIIKELPEIEKLSEKTIFITGATGLICSSLIDILFRYNDTHSVPVNIIAGGRSLKKAESRYGYLVNRSDFRFNEYDALKSDNVFPSCCDYIIHGASNAYPEAIAREPVETMIGNFVGVKHLLDFAVKQKTKRLLFISSSEIYGNNGSNQPRKENEYGYIDILNPRNSYSISKQAAEALCRSYSEEYNVDSVIVRPGHIYGPTASVNDNRVSSAWAFAAARGEDIIMKSSGDQIRSYCYCLDCSAAILKVLINGEKGRAYNISNADSIISIKKLAELFAEAADSEVVINTASFEEKRSFNPMSNSSLNSDMLEKLNWKGVFDSKEGIAHTVSILKEIYYS